MSVKQCLCSLSWGEFDIQIRIFFVPESGEKNHVLLYHHLKLHPWVAVGSGESEIPSPDAAIRAGPVHSWQYEEIVFNDPLQSFLNLLLAHPPTPLPKTKRRPIPFHVSHPESIADIKAGGTPEFHQAMIQEEVERLDKAKKQIIAEQNRLREILIEKEKELENLKQQLAT